MKPRSLVIDGNSAFARAWFATVEKNDVDVNGDRVAAVNAALSMVMAPMDPIEYSEVHATLFCWDTGSKTVKPRDPKPPEFFDELKRFVDYSTKLFGSAHAFPVEQEGDDGVATAVSMLLARGERCMVCSGDKDLQQLTGDDVEYYCFNEKTRLSRTYISQRWNVKRPSQIAIALAILGDRQDGVPGIRGWGPKKVEALFSEVREDMTFSQVLEHVDGLIPADKKDAFYHSLDLVLLDPGVPGVPLPSPLAFGDASELQCEFVTRRFNQLKSRYKNATSTSTGGIDYDER